MWWAAEATVALSFSRSEEYIHVRSGSVLPIFVLITFAALARAGEPVSTTGSTEAVQVIGFGDIKKNTKGTLELKDGFFISRQANRAFMSAGT